MYFIKKNKNNVSKSKITEKVKNFVVQHIKAQKSETKHTKSFFSIKIRIQSTFSRKKIPIKITKNLWYHKRDHSLFTNSSYFPVCSWKKTENVSFNQGRS